MSSVGKMDLGAMRVPHEPDVERDFSIKNPIALFDKWFNEARKTGGIKDANAMAVGTADKHGKPSVRYVLLKSYSKDGFIFFTNYNSRKGQDITENPHVALAFYWEPLCRQIRIEGTAVKISEKESTEYFNTRAKDARLAAVVSKHGNVIENKEALVKEKEDLDRKYTGESTTIPKPDYWGGYLIKPDTVEFWCGRSDRLHDRIKFRHPSSNEVLDEKLTHHGEDGWVYEYISP